MKKTLRVELNGTDKNIYFDLWGLKHNPFPQLAEYSRNSSCLALQSLAGDPIPDTNYIRDRLEGHYTKEFIDYVCSKFVPGERVSFDFSWNE